MKRTFQNDFERAYYYARRARFWSGLSVIFAAVSLVAVVVGAILGAS